MSEYVVRWVGVFGSDCPRDAALQAAGAIEDAMRNPVDGASILLVYDGDDNLVAGYDEWGQGRHISGDTDDCNDEECWCKG